MTNFIKSLHTFCPKLMNDFSDWMKVDKKITDWKTYKDEAFIGWLMSYISSVYQVFPDLLVYGDYPEDFQPDDMVITCDLPEFETFAYNLLCECKRIENELFELIVNA